MEEGKDYLGRHKRAEEDKKQIENFKNLWIKEAKDIREGELTENDARAIILNYEAGEAGLKCGMHVDLTNRSTFQELEIVRSKLFNSVMMAKSNYKAKHKNPLERLIDAIGKSMGAILLRK